MAGETAATGVLLVDKPGGLTSHDVVSRSRRALNTRKVGHAGTLDPMATGLLVLGVGAATRLLTYVVGLDKTYETTILLGASTDTDDADGTVVSRADAPTLQAVTDEQIRAGIVALTGDIEQVPSTVSAIKVAGRRAYDLARAGEDVVLASRAVTVSRFEVLAVRRAAEVIELDAVVDCSSGTYIRALARDLGTALGVGGHLTALRRTRIGSFDVSRAVDLEHIDPDALLQPAAAAAMALPTLAVSDDEARDLRHGKRLSGAASRVAATPAAAIGPDGALIGVLERRGGDLKSAMNMPEELA
ncbi:tRNA pseudouridine55 synthase [Microbacterium sp. SORGH_AS428]|uniref:tRNA pseudouridine(55) synthase TruB n=1 Tax=Microbacterium sp. SORGH_AS_0428 TaxID=3041788 RepID=UPI0028583573|nr:tRNA pseudouridine(55) synthase TruB [Microbacterium sp. SORGH_AS_0428]MDR6198923.1 tRNA pseudouridine55 synthase [Microbacterium sp. SORGH_AS_0428]